MEGGGGEAAHVESSDVTDLTSEADHGDKKMEEEGAESISDNMTDLAMRERDPLADEVARDVPSTQRLIAAITALAGGFVRRRFVHSRDSFTW